MRERPGFFLLRDYEQSTSIKLTEEDDRRLTSQESYLLWAALRWKQYHRWSQE
ncbi:MAG: hypothetical protein AVDCRST_MAG37-192 [uncultured Rubrobacteraceae bacterium]|uniref:Uncharacterized protein n=1 Tax=uncultured Rubrobacteraceae bacterium TaxID=349277 RepID=A0A6J4PXQ5_9ACTN|nr:MAG: hypothetical protein AVDCRST_MAG37-192 [uncultured Rubrobacteraceae bacterium]